MSRCTRCRAGGQEGSGAAKLAVLLMRVLLGPAVRRARPLAAPFILACTLVAFVTIALDADVTWKVATPERRVALPADHASHPDYKIEWWYYTGNVATSAGRRFGYQLTFFRVGVDPQPANPSRWAIRDLYMAHFAVSDLASKRFHAFDRLQRPGAGWAGAAVDRYEVWNGAWRAAAQPDGAHRLQAKSGDVSADFVVSGTARAVTHGLDGYSRKGRDPSNASHYYSLPRLDTRGVITIGGERFEVTGLSWMDHEFGTSMLEPEQVGWDWFALQLADGRDIMLYQMRRRGGARDPFSSGSIVAPDGRVTRLEAGDYTLEPLETWQSPETKTRYPVRWRVIVPRAGPLARGRGGDAQSGAAHAAFHRRHLLGRRRRRHGRLRRRPGPRPRLHGADGLFGRAAQ
jgi:predicted secreted hydrolase